MDRLLIIHCGGPIKMSPF